MSTQRSPKYRFCYTSRDDATIVPVEFLCIEDKTTGPAEIAGRHISSLWDRVIGMSQNNQSTPSGDELPTALDLLTEHLGMCPVISEWTVDLQAGLLFSGMHWFVTVHANATHKFRSHLFVRWSHRSKTIGLSWAVNPCRVWPGEPIYDYTYQLEQLFVNRCQTTTEALSAAQIPSVLHAIVLEYT